MCVFYCLLKKKGDKIAGDTTTVFRQEITLDSEQM